jgi:N-acetylmuramoyl-L-alanine amidase
MNRHRYLLPTTLALAALLGGFAYLSSCSSTPKVGGSYGGGPAVTPLQMLGEANVRQDLIPAGTYGRKVYRPMFPSYITIHATENKTGDAYAHARALKAGALRAHKRPGGNRIGFLTWHFTVQDDVAIQHLPTREQGEHADFDGKGNNYSIGIEMCEHNGNSIPQTLERTAKLAACLMKQYNIPLSHVVPHYYWPRVGTTPEHKPCPHYLMTNGKPGRQWGWFLGLVKSQYQRLTEGPAPRLQ